jgi:FKBP-type peptidyl-prolyl cis-trans isomerase
MSRQITDLSAAGANLFHAVVELQRLRASSERKFQRWFYEHRQEQEKAQEREAQLEHTLRVEREARADHAGNMERMATEKKNAERAVQEMRRELQISKEEARRAWEELGRREQEERDRTFSLREGQPTLVGGVQVVPLAQGMGRQAGQRASEDVFGPGPSSSQGIEQHYSYEEGQSPTDTDPFTEVGRHVAPAPSESEVSYLGQGSYVPTGVTAAQTQATRPTAPPTQSPLQSPIPAPLNPQRFTEAHEIPGLPSTSNPEAFYQQPDAYLHREIATTIPEDERSYVTSHGEGTSEGDEEFAIDEYGNFILDNAGHRVPYRSLRHQDSDEYDVHDDRRRELEHLARYGTAAPGPGNYATTSSAGPAYQQQHPTLDAPDYSGQGYGSEWAGMRHHHPTRLSDVVEEDERSRTSPSRASQHSRGRY